MSNKYYSQLIEEEYSCPNCSSREIQFDGVRSEIFCSKCGLVISSPSGGVLPYDFSEVKHVPKVQEKSITNFRHNLTNKQLMKIGLRNTQ